MPANISDYLEAKLLDHSLGRTSFTMPSNVRVALFTSATTDAGGGTEVSGGAYARQSLTIDAAASGATQNSAEILFPIATAGWGTITHVAIMDATTGGNVLWHGPLVTPRQIDTSDQFRLAVGELDVSLD